MELPPADAAGKAAPASAEPNRSGLGEPFGTDPGWLPLSPRLLRMRRLEALGGGSVCLLLALVVGVAAGSLALTVLLLLLVLALSGLTWGYMGRRFTSWGYLEREQDLLVRRGVMFRRLSVVPYGRMQSVEVTAGPPERFFGLATVRLHTASAATDARIPGLVGADATKLRDRLASLGEANAEGL